VKRALALALLLALAACGADGPPERPAPGVTVGGDVRLGVTLGR
jgi:predicted small lipoprotein YifL